MYNYNHKPLRFLVLSATYSHLVLLLVWSCRLFPRSEPAWSRTEENSQHPLSSHPLTHSLSPPFTRSPTSSYPRSTKDPTFRQLTADLFLSNSCRPLPPSPLFLCLYRPCPLSNRAPNSSHKLSIALNSCFLSIFPSRCYTTIPTTPAATAHEEDSRPELTLYRALRPDENDQARRARRERTAEGVNTIRALFLNLITSLLAIPPVISAAFSISPIVAVVAFVGTYKRPPITASPHFSDVVYLVSSSSSGRPSPTSLLTLNRTHFPTLSSPPPLPRSS